jgi:hypothetical protein
MALYIETIGLLTNRVQRFVSNVNVSKHLMREA